MNAYTVSNFTPVNEPSIYMIIAVLVLAPLLVGSVIDITFTQIAGSQYCSYRDGSTRCTILNYDLSALARELYRFILQLAVVICVIIGFTKMAPVYTAMLGKTPLSLLGFVLFAATQADLMEDFRRLLNGLLFLIKHR